MLVEVALPVPVPQTFGYEMPDGVAAGVRVRVPFGRRSLIGWVVGPHPGPRPKRVRAVQEVLDSEPIIGAELLALCRWVADYYLAPLGIVLRAALPAALGDPARAAAPPPMRQVVRLAGDRPGLTRREEIFGRAAKQRECYEAIEAAGGATEVAHLAQRLGFSRSVVRGLVSKGLASIVEEAAVRDPFAEMPREVEVAHALTGAQVAARDALVAAAMRAAPGRPELPFVLLGVTGSGKTLVYIELLEEVVRRQGKGAIVLVPEIALTPQTVARFRARFGNDIAVLHSALSDGERLDAWRALRAGEKRIAIGARSAIYAPVQQLGAILVDEEHEATYKQSEAPRYHAREVAVVRARMAGAVCVLGSATPSLESWYNTRTGKYRLLELPERVEGRPLPPVRVIDLREPDPAAGPSGSGREGSRSILTEPLREAMRLRLERGEQCILLLNRRGYATFVQCRSCGEVWRCERCSVSLTFHRARRRLVCHYCFHEEPSPVRCDACGSGDLWFRGIGTEQVEREVTDTFPTARVARMDVDTTSAKWSHHEILGRVGRGQVDILLGTQMIAKGLDFAGVTLVGVVNADVAMNLPDFRASERTFQLLTQVAGRAGRGPKGGEVLVQTALPGHYAIRAALEHDYRRFAERELEERVQPRYPPHTRLANVVLSAVDPEAVEQAAQHAAGWTRETIEARQAGVELVGPAPCPIERIRGRWRWHFLLRGDVARALGAVGEELQHRYVPASSRAELRIVLDRDPVTLL